jgi:hypothetical protein
MSKKEKVVIVGGHGKVRGDGGITMSRPPLRFIALHTCDTCSLARGTHAQIALCPTQLLGDK